MKMLAQHLIVECANGSKVEVNEPLVNQSNPNINFRSITGGELEVGSMYWVSKLEDVKKGDHVLLDNEKKYTVVGIAQDIAGGLTIYSLKYNNERRRGGDSRF